VSDGAAAEVAAHRIDRDVSGASQKLGGILPVLGRQNRRPKVSPTTSCAPSAASSHHHPVATATAASTPTVAWLKRGARASITSRSRYGSASRFISESVQLHFGKYC
jgi:hypothetical protein